MLKNAPPTGTGSPLSETGSPCYFGPEERPLFGWLHGPASGIATGPNVVLCPPLGFEGLFAHPALRYAAIRLASAGCAVVRFDYDGTGDSSGTDQDADRVAAWVSSVRHAATLVREAAPGGPLVLLGLRAGALLACEVALEMGDVDGLVLWAPVERGGRFVREQHAFSMVATTGPTDPEGQASTPDGFEANGFVFTEETSQALKGIDLRKIDFALPPRTLILDRDDQARDALSAWDEKGWPVDRLQVPDYVAMMDPPLEAVQPTEAVDRLVEWLAGFETAERGCVLPPSASDTGSVGPGAVDTIAWYAEDRHRFGILTSPESSATAKIGYIILNNAMGNRTGPSRMYVPTSRNLAAQGICTLRLDLAGVGDSTLPDGRDDHHVYALDTVDDVAAAVRFMRARGVERVAVGGLCSGAFLAWHAAAAIESIQALLLVNLQIFEWKEGDSLDVTPLQNLYESQGYSDSFRSLAKWKKVLLGEVDVKRAIAVMAERLRYELTGAWARVKVRFGIGRHTSIADQAELFREQGTSVHFVFSGGDPGIRNLDKALGSDLRALTRSGAITIDTIDGPDHSFTPQWASDTLEEWVLRRLDTAAQ